MKKELETRLKKLEKRYGPKPDPERVTRVSWMSGEDQRRGLRPGVYRIASDDSSTAPPGSVTSKNRRVLLAYRRG